MRFELMNELDKLPVLLGSPPGAPVSCSLRTY